MRTRYVVLLAILITCVAIPVAAQDDLYDNGPTNGTTDAWTINFGFAVSDTFTFTSAAEASGLNFAAWLFPGDILESAELSLTSSEFGGTTYFDGTVLFTQSGCITNQLGFSLCSETGSFSPVLLNAGTYWLTLQNAVVNTGDPVYWDENSGPSQASENTLGTIPSESFTWLGECSNGKNSPDCAPPPTSPEPGSLLLLGSGVLLTIGTLRRFL